EHDLLLELFTTEAAVQPPEEGNVLGASALAQPVDRLLSPLLGYIAPLRERAEGLHGTITSLLGKGKRRLVHQRGILGRPEDRIESRDRCIGANLGEPEDCLL